MYVDFTLAVPELEVIHTDYKIRALRAVRRAPYMC